jgi:hypothetical protein
MNDGKELLKRLIEEAIESIVEQNALSMGNVAGTSASPVGMKPEVFDPEKPKPHKNASKKNK